MRMTLHLKKIISVIITLCFLFTITIPVSAQETDISKHWARSTFEKWTSDGLLKGYSDGSYKPNNIVTKAEFLAFIDRIFKYTDTSDKKIKDVASNSWYENYFLRAIAAGIINVDENENMQPNKALTRGETAFIIAKAFNLKAEHINSIEIYTDYNSFPEETRDAIAALTEKGFIKGNADKSFGFSRLVTRAEAITMINNAMGTIIKTSETYKNSVTGNLIVNSKDVVLKDMTINGDLYLTQGIGQGDVTLENVKVTGKTYVFGGGVNSVKIKDSILTGTLVLLKKDGKLRVVAQGSTEIADTQLYSGAVLEEDNLTGKGFVNMTIMQINPAGNVIKLSGDFNNLDVRDKGADIQLLNGSANFLKIYNSGYDSKIYVAVSFKLTNISAEARLTVSGSGKIINAYVLSSEVVFEQIPTNMDLTAGMTVIISGSVVSASYSNMGTSGTTGSTGGNPVVTPAPTAAPTPTTAAPTPTTAVPTPTTAPADISGTISFAEPPADITSTNIQLKQNGVNAGSVVHPDNTGAYNITDVAAGTYIIEISLEGYKTAVTESFNVSGTDITDKNVALEKSTPSPDGELLVLPGKAVPGDSKIICLDYTSAEKLVNGTVVFTLPQEFTATPGDLVNIGTYSALETYRLTEGEISNNGKTVTVSNITSTGIDNHEYITLSLFDKIIPAAGNYTFSAKADTDGIATNKTFSTGTGYETDTFTAVNGPVDDFIATSTNTAVQFNFSPSRDATSVVLEMKTYDSSSFSPAPGVSLTPESYSAVVNGLTNGKLYVFRLVVTGGNHNGTSQLVYACPTRVDPDNSTATINNPLAINRDGTFNYTSTITLTLKDSAGNLITNSSESFSLYIGDVYKNINKLVFINNETEPIEDPSLAETLNYYLYDILTDSEGKITIRISLKAPSGSDCSTIVIIGDSNDELLGVYTLDQ